MLMQKIDFYEQYPDLTQFLGQFAADADFDIFDENHTICRVFRPHNPVDIVWKDKILTQAHQILAMEPFPRAEVSHAAGGLFKDEQKVKDWLVYVLDLLEKRVKGEL